MEELKKIKLVFALGNPGDNYVKTFHNAGLLALSRIIGESSFKEKEEFSFFKKGRFIFAKSSLFMNESGLSVLKAANFFKIQPEEILILQDDSDLELGEIKVSYGRNSAGHKGVESIIKSLKTKDFWRARFGIRKNTKERKKAEDFVLKKMTQKDLEKIYLAADFLKEKLKLNSTSGPA